MSLPRDKAQLNVVIDRGLRNELKAVAARQGKSLARVVAEALRLYLSGVGNKEEGA